MLQSRAPYKKRSFSDYCSSSLTEGNPAPSDEEQSLIASAKKLLGYDPYPLINFLGHLFAKDANKCLRSEAEAVYNCAKKYYPNGLASRTCDLYWSTYVATTKRRCMTLLYRLLHQDGIWTAKILSVSARNELKTSFFNCLNKEQDYIALNTLISLVAEIGANEFCEQEWSLLFENMFQSLESTSDPKKHVASRLFEEMIPKCPEIFRPHIERLREALENLMGSDSFMVSVPAVGAALNLVRYLAPSETYQNYRDYLNHAEDILFKSILLNEHEYAQTVLEDFLALAENKIGFVRFNISNLFRCMVVIAEMSDAKLKNRQLAIELVLKVAENGECGCGLIQKMPDNVRRLLAVLVEMLVPVEDDPSYSNRLEAENYDQDVGVSPAYSFAGNSLSRIANAVRGNVVGTEFLEALNQGMDDTNWKKRHTSVVALGLVSKGCSKIMVKNLGRLVDKVQNLLRDDHLRVRWRAIQAVALFCKAFSPYLQEQFHSQLIPAITRAMDDFRNPRIQMEKRMLKEAALTALASLAASSKEDFLEYYDIVMSNLKVILLTAKKNVDCFLIAKTVDCTTMVGLAVGKEKFQSDAEKVTELLMSLQESGMVMDGPVRSHLLQAWGRLCKSLGTKFLPFLKVVMPQLIWSLRSTSNLTVTINPDDMKYLNDDRVTTKCSKIGLQSDELIGKASACNVFCWLAAELKGGLHMWIYELENALVPLINCELHEEEVRTAAISGMPLLLQSAVSATKKGLPLYGFSELPIESLTRSIIPDLVDALAREPKTEICAKTLEALNSCMQVAGCYLKKDHFEQFLDSMNLFLTTFAYKTTEREKRVNEGLDVREQELLEEEINQEKEVYQKIGDCLGTFVKTHKASVSLFNKILPFIERFWGADKIAEERNIGVRIFHVFAEECQPDARRFYLNHCLPFLLEACHRENPEVQKAVAHGIAICAEFGRVDFKDYVEGAVSKLSAIIQHPNALLPGNVMAHEAAISALGRICLFHTREIETPEVFSLWLSYLPIKNNSEEAKIVHDQLCLMLAMSNNKKVIGPEGANITRILGIFAEILWAGNHLATDKTIKLMKNLLKRFQQRASPEFWAQSWLTLPHCQQKMLERIM